jgi:hypothetical protein
LWEQNIVLCSILFRQPNESEAMFHITILPNWCGKGKICSICRGDNHLNVLHLKINKMFLYPKKWHQFSVPTFLRCTSYGGWISFHFLQMQDRTLRSTHDLIWSVKKNNLVVEYQKYRSIFHHGTISLPYMYNIQKV